MSEPRLTHLLDRLETLVVRLEKAQGVTPPAPSSSAAAPVVMGEGEDEGEAVMEKSQFAMEVVDALPAFVEMSKAIDPKVGEIAELFHQALIQQDKFLQCVSRSKKPKDSVLADLLKPTVEIMTKITEFRNANRGPIFNHLSTISEGVGVLGWVAVPTPMSFIPEMDSAAKFYSNKIRVQYKSSDPEQIKWVSAFHEIVDSLFAYVKANCRAGIKWNPNGGDAVEVMKSLTSAPKAPVAAAPGPPPPPPPPPPPVFDPVGAESEDKGKDQMSAVLAEIGSGKPVTSGLRHVTADMKTKNMKDRSSDPIPSSSTAPAKKSVKKSAPAVLKEAVLKLDGKRWIVENQRSNQGVEIEVESIGQVVYIADCEASVIRVHGKCNAINMVNCKKCGVVFDSVVSVCEVVNCKAIELQVLHSIPSVQIDKTDGCRLYVSKEAMNVKIVTSKASEINVVIPSEDGDIKEYPVPEQFVTSIGKSSLSTVANEHV